MKKDGSVSVRVVNYSDILYSIRQIEKDSDVEKRWQNSDVPLRGFKIFNYILRKKVIDLNVITGCQRKIYLLQ